MRKGQLNIFEKMPGWDKFYSGPFFFKEEAKVAKEKAEQENPEKVFEVVKREPAELVK